MSLTGRPCNRRLMIADHFLTKPFFFWTKHKKVGKCLCLAEFLENDNTTTKIEVFSLLIFNKWYCCVYWSTGPTPEAFWAIFSMEKTEWSERFLFIFIHFSISLKIHLKPKTLWYFEKTNIELCWEPLQRYCWICNVLINGICDFLQKNREGRTYFIFVKKFGMEDDESLVNYTEEKTKPIKY